MGVLRRLGSAPLLLATIMGAGALASGACSGSKATAPIEGPLGGYHNLYFNGMRYGLYVPQSYTPSRKYPLILYLHGSTDTTSWDFEWYHDPIQSQDPVFVLSPKSVVPGLGWGASWEVGFSPDMQNTMDLLASTLRDFSIDTTRLYVTGTSMGGFGTFNVLSRRPGLFAAAYALCGGGTTASAAQMAQTPLWIFHGSADPVVSVQYSRDIYRAIQQAGGTQVRYTEYPGVGHNVWDYTPRQKTLQRWFLAQRKGVAHGAPDAVSGVQASVSGGQLSLSWSAPADTTSPDHAVWFYRVFRDGSLVAEVETPGYTDAAPPAGTRPAYAVASVNYFFKESARSPQVQAAIP
ncbi:MAG TPA: alpha/beta hydrolase [Longimicrobiales bacterium]